MVSEKSAKVFAIAAVAIFIVSLMPIVAAGFYSHPSSDDYAYSLETSKAWRETESLANVLDAAFQRVKYTYETWQGTYAGVFLFTLQPDIFGEGLYFITTLWMLFWLIFGVLFLSRVLARECAGGKGYLWLAISVPPLCAYIQMLGIDGRSSLFYWNGAILYTFPMSLFLVLCGLIIKLIRNPRMATAAIAAVVGVVAAGGGFPVVMLCLCLVFVPLWLFIKKHEAKWHSLIAVLPAIAGCCASVLAKGNFTRLGTYSSVFYDIPLYAVIPISVAEGIYTAGDTISAPFILTLLIISPFLYSLAGKSKVRHPFLRCIASLLLVSGMFVPIVLGGQIYAQRAYNIAVLAFWILSVLNLHFIFTWVIAKYGFKPALPKTKSVAIAIAFFIALSTIKISYDYKHQIGREIETGLQIEQPLSASILYEFITGSPQAYNAAYNNIISKVKNSQPIKKTEFARLLQTAPPFFYPAHLDNQGFDLYWLIGILNTRYDASIVLLEDQ
jgi:hypothetical protein